MVKKFYVTPMKSGMNPGHFHNHKNFLTEGNIQLLEETILDLKYQEGVTYTQDPNQKEQRKSQIKWIPHEEKFYWLFDKIYGIVHEVNQNFYNFSIIGTFDYIQYTEYRATNSGFYDWHMDIGPFPANSRKISVTIQLSDPEDYEGGDLKIFTGGNIENSITMAKEKGSITIFPSYMMHTVTPVTKGIRKSLVLWLGGTSFT